MTNYNAHADGTISHISISYVCWPRLDAEMEELVKSCQQCQTVKSAPSKGCGHPDLVSYPDPNVRNDDHLLTV